MRQIPVPRKGCFTSSYPIAQWQEAPCTTAPAVPFPPARGPRTNTVGNGTDVSAEVAGHISTSVGSFDSASGVTSETGTNPYTFATNVPNVYSLQLNSNVFTTVACDGAANPSQCQGWQQFVYTSDNTSPYVFMQYWLINYAAVCPSGWIPFSSDCYTNSNAIVVPQETIANLINLSVTGEANSGGNDTVIMSTGATLYTVTAADNVVNLAESWQDAEFNIFGDGDGTAANFNSGSTLVVRTSVDYGSPSGPSCTGQGFTGETNNLNFATAPTAQQESLPAIVFTEGTSGSVLSPCNSATSVAANASSYTLSVSLAGSGSGSVTSSPSGISCPGDCTESYASGTSVTLSAAAGAGSTFAGWSGACNGTGTCNVGMTQARSVTATFNQSPVNYTLSVYLAGDGSGTVTSSPSGISCPGDCSESYANGTSVTLSAAAGVNSVFVGWSLGVCSGTGSCTVSMTEAQSVTATFHYVPKYPLLVGVDGDGTGTVSSSPSGISCPGDCSEDYASGTSVTLSATAGVGSTFAGWGGECSGTGSCNVSMTQVRNVSATFNSPNYTLSVSLAGGGSGTVTSSPSGIGCPGDCSEDYASGTSVTLSAAAGAGSSFAGWGGDCSGTGSCNVSMTQARNVSATFNSSDYTLSVSLAGGGGSTVTSSPGGIDCPGFCSQDYAKGARVTLVAAPASGWAFVNWTEGGAPVSTSSIYPFTLTSNLDLVANFVTSPSLTCTMAFVPATIRAGQNADLFWSSTNATGGTISPLVGAVGPSGSTNVGTFTTQRLAGVFNGTGGETTTCSATLTVVFAITVSASPPAGGTVSGGGTFPSESTQSVTATPKIGFRFLDWLEANVEESAAKVYSFTLTQNRTLVAKFAPAHVARNDLVESRGSAGTWEYLDNHAWTKINNAGATQLATGDLNGNGKDEVVAVLSSGLWVRSDTGTWIRIDTRQPLHVAVGDLDNDGKADVVADFSTGGSGLFARMANTGLWTKLREAVAQGLAIGDLNGNGKAEVIVTDGTGTWVRYDNAGAFVRLSSLKALHVAVGDLDGNGKGDVVADFTGTGLFARMNNAGAWVKLNANVTQGLAVGDLDGDHKDDILGVFPSGLYARYSGNGALVRLNANAASHILAGDLDSTGKEEAIAVFGNLGLFVRYNNAGAFQKLNTGTAPIGPATALAVGGVN